MKAITLWQPWATFVAKDFKTFETRSWGTAYRGQIAIHAAKRYPMLNEINELFASINRNSNPGKPISSEDKDGLINYTRYWMTMPFGAIIAIADLTDCLLMLDRHTERIASIEISRQSSRELALGFWQTGRYAWKLENVRSIIPVPCMGRQGLWPVNEVLRQKIELHLAYRATSCV